MLGITLDPLHVLPANVKEAVTYLSYELANLLKFEPGCLSSMLLALHWLFVSAIFQGQTGDE